MSAESRVSARISLGKSISRSFERLQQAIRERAYHIFAKRAPGAGDPESDWLHAQAELLVPVVLEFREHRHSVVASCDLKGFEAKDIEIEIDGDTLRILGSHRETRSRKVRGATVSESGSRFFYQAVQLPCEVDADGADAQLLKNGKLKIKLPKKQTSR